jgi:hypothetical protein
VGVIPSAFIGDNGMRRAFAGLVFLIGLLASRRIDGGTASGGDIP